jgi:hydrogenase expression/formation protein HypC
MCLAVPGELIELCVRDGLRFGTVKFAGITREVCLEYQPQAKPGDFVLVHVGFAIAIVDPAEAERQWQLLRDLADEEP